MGRHFKKDEMASVAREYIKMSFSVQCTGGARADHHDRSKILDTKFFVLLHSGQKTWNPRLVELWKQFLQLPLRL